LSGKQRRHVRSIGQPISPTLKRGVIRCRRCNSRIVSNVDHCPYCGKNLLPVHRRLWFWLIVVVLLSGTVFAFVYFNAPASPTEPMRPAQSSRPSVVGAPAGSSYKNLALGTPVTVDQLEVEATRYELGPTGANGAQLYVLTIEFVNTRDQAVTLYSTQWRIEGPDGGRYDTYRGAAADGQSISGNFEAFELAAGGRFTGRLYFLGDVATRVVYQPSALAYSEDLLVTWTVPRPPQQDGATGTGTGGADSAGYDTSGTSGSGLA
jgi:hypothetical protein